VDHAQRLRAVPPAVAVVNPLAERFGIDLADGERDPERIWTAIGRIESGDGDTRFAAAAARELLRLAGARLPSAGESSDGTALATLWPTRRARRRGWRVLRRHLTVPRLALPEALRALALMPSVAAGAWLIADMRPDIGGAVFAWAPLVLINLMLLTLAERVCGWRPPSGAGTVADLERRLFDSPHDHPWTRERVAETVTAPGERA